MAVPAEFKKQVFQGALKGIGFAFLLPVLSIILLSFMWLVVYWLPVIFFSESNLPVWYRVFYSIVSFEAMCILFDWVKKKKFCYDAGLIGMIKMFYTSLLLYPPLYKAVYQDISAVVSIWRHEAGDRK